MPPALLADYRSEISAEFEGYFEAISSYITCLDAERARSLAEAREVTAAYAAFLETTPVQ